LINLNFECEYLLSNEKDELIKKYETIGKMLQSMLEKASIFCNPEAVSKKTKDRSTGYPFTDTEY
jgi:hypothetical protein